jgi:hypothetical protein
MACLRYLTLCPCPHCLLLKSKIPLIGSKMDTKSRLQLARKDDEAQQRKVENAHRLMFKGGVNITSVRPLGAPFPPHTFQKWNFASVKRLRAIALNRPSFLSSPYSHPRILSTLIIAKPVTSWPFYKSSTGQVKLHWLSVTMRLVPLMIVTHNQIASW